MKIKKIYLDMDGVLCDFDKMFNELFGDINNKYRDRKHFTEHWPKFIEADSFKTLDLFPGAEELLAFVKQFPEIKIEILTSSGGERYHNEVKKQKKYWLRNHLIDYTANVVPGRSHKKDYATPETILIDDTEDVIVSFNRAGGIGILHKDIGETLTKLKTLLATDTK